MTIRIIKPPQYVYRKFISYNKKNKFKITDKISDNILADFFKTPKDYELFKKYEDDDLVIKYIFLINKIIKKNSYIEYISYKSKLKLLDDSINFYYERMERFCIDEKDLKWIKSK